MCNCSNLGMPLSACIYLLFFFFFVLQVVIFAKHFDKRFWSTLTSMETVFVRSHLAHVVLCAFCIASPGSECAFCWSLHLQCVFIWIFFFKIYACSFCFSFCCKKKQQNRCLSHSKYEHFDLVLLCVFSQHRCMCSSNACLVLALGSVNRFLLNVCGPPKPHVFN